MVNVEADVLAGSLLAREAEAAGIVYSMAYGDQPALTCELVDWGRLCGFQVVGGGEGHPVPAGLSRLDAGHGVGLLRPHRRPGRGGAHELADVQTPFLDGTKSAIEMAAIANATGLTPAPRRLGLPAVRHRRFAARHAARRGGWPAAPQGAGGSRVIPGTRWPTGVSRLALGASTWSLKRRMPMPRTCFREIRPHHR